MGNDTKSPNIVTIRKYDNVVEAKGDFPDVEKGEAIFTHVLPETLFPDSSGIVFFGSPFEWNKGQFGSAEEEDNCQWVGQSKCNRWVI